MQTIQSIAQSLTSRLGSDLKFPIMGNFQPISGVQLLLQDIQQLLLTMPGERVFRPTYGCYLRTQVWENMASVQVSGAAAIKTALQAFEPRITVLDVSSTANENTGLVTFNIQFLVNTTDNVLNLVFPFRVGQQLSFA